MLEALQLATTGILMGIIHVLAGPDHLSALATLSGTILRSDKENGYLQSFLLGIKWGLGHTFGLIVVGAILFALDIPFNSEVSNLFEAFVGVFMVGLGCYGMHKAFSNRSNFMAISICEIQMPASDTNLKAIAERDDEDCEEGTNHRSSIFCEMTQVLAEDSEQFLDLSLKSSARSTPRIIEEEIEVEEDDDDVESRIYKAARSIGRMTEIGSSVMTVPLNKLTSSLKSIGSVDSGSKLITKSPSHLLLERHGEMLEEFSEHGSKAEHTAVNNAPARNSCTTGALAILAGIVHGVAGPGGVLGIIPAVQLRDPLLSTVYLGTFCFTSCIVMGSFAVFYGTFSKWLASGDGNSNRGFLVEAGSASLSLFVGITWIVLLSLGKLQDIFP